MNRWLPFLVSLQLAACSGSEEVDPYALLAHHDGYWVAEVDSDELPVPVTVVNDLHVDVDTRRNTVYAQAILNGEVLSPPQVGPDECTTSLAGTVCYHPNAVYLDGSGNEALESNGTGAWWVKHSWVVDGEGYTNCTLAPPRETYDDCFPVEATLLDDGLTVRIGDLEEGPYNERRPLLDEDPVRYEVLADVTDQALALVFDCTEDPSALDGESRPCPAPE